MSGSWTRCVRRSVEGTRIADIRAPLRIGVDSYSYHRLLGEVRPGEAPSRERLSDGGFAVIAEARRLGLDGVSLETCFLGALDLTQVRALVDSAYPLEVVFAWGAPNGRSSNSRMVLRNSALPSPSVMRPLISTTVISPASR